MCAAVLPASSVTSVVMPPTLAPQMKPTPATKSPTPSARVPTPVVAAACSKALHKLTLSRLLAGFFWRGDSSVYGSKWKLGLFEVRSTDDPGITIPSPPGLEQVEKCMSSMQTGTQMVKLRGGSKGLVRFFYLDEHKSCIRWRPSRKNEKAKISIDSIREVCEGKQSEIFQRYADGSFDPNCCFSIYYGEHMESLDLVSGTGEEARTWITGLKYLMAGISDEDSLAKRQRTRDQYPS
ncbi:1-phosphatidylinositol 4,5-bisphosphate phosphodiesterase eta-2-like isoform X1 [Labeo rohita]|uniref:1-phosphatidylinositol 4,5-bisphosphate phosphodiesterase eta-2-like isoform X1 n=1 Tax=Labeo rohita TaxID=84645 RepID=A0A498LZ26_LABRO|nr:1-phosphatidylinositol 4,5-bisphosphate phosphodiesterase eta-2-like isoform X1 [Labeo rohita]